MNSPLPWQNDPLNIEPPFRVASMSIDRCPVPLIETYYKKWGVKDLYGLEVNNITYNITSPLSTYEREWTFFERETRRFI